MLIRSQFSMMAMACTLMIGSIAMDAKAQGKAETQAEQLFREARKLVVDGNFQDACPKFADSLKLDPAPGTLMNLADCEQRIGSLISAKEHFQLAASGFPKNDPRRALCATRATELEPRIAHLTLNLASPVAGAEVTKNGVQLADANLGVDSPTDPGDIVLVVTAPGREDKTTTLHLKEGETQTATLDIGAPLPVARPSIIVRQVGESAKSRTLRNVGFAVGAVGVASVAVGAVTGLLTMGYATTVKDHCNTTTYNCDGAGYDAAHSGQITSPISTITLIAGGVLLATGIAIVVISNKSKKEPAPRAYFVPSVGPHGSQASFVASF